ncbi:MAG: hypothetical protein KF708_06960 [Pirellulales bacterium]|nr:hypothetical protein [Pirellulales bacterium]
MEKPPELTDRDWQILLHVYRYRVSNIRIIWQRFCPEGTHGAARNIVRRMVTEGWIRKWPLDQKRHFLTLNSRGALVCKAKNWSAARFSEQSLPALFGVLHYCLRTGHKRLTPSELHEMDPGFATQAGWAHAYYVHTAQQGLCLSCCLIDRRNSPQRLVTRGRGLIVDCYKIPAFRAFIDAGRFTVTILTAYQSMVEPILAEVRRRHRGPVMFRVEVVPEIADYLPQRQ